MSGADCNSGCTDCPTCRGEVQPDSPAMHDMNFAMAMEMRAFADPMWGPLRVAHAVREGIRERGAQSVDDRRMLEFVDGVQREAVAQESADPWGTPFGLFEERSDPPAPAPPAPAPAPAPEVVRKLDWDNRRPRVADVKNKKISGATLNPMRSRKRMLTDYPPTVITPNWDPGEFIPLRPGQVPVRGKLRVPPIQESKRRCCVENFLFPEFMRSTTQGPRVSFEFWTYAEYKEDGGCACACCYFEQYARRLDINQTYRQDCRWTDNSGGKHSVVSETPPDGAPIDCDDTQHSGEVVGGVADAAKHWSELRRVSALESACVHRYYDEPYQMAWGGSYDFTWEFVGIIYDVCHDWTVQRTGWLQWRERSAQGGYPAVSRGASEDGDGNPTTAETTKPPPPGLMPPSRKPA